MTITVTHSKVSAVTDTADTSLVRPSDWNATHVVTGSVTESFILAASSEAAPASAENGVLKFRMPYAFTVASVKASLSTAQTSGSIFTVDINETGSSILSTKLTIDNGEKTSVTAATQPVVSDNGLAADAEMSIDIDQIGDGTAIGLKVTIIGTQA